MHVLITPRIPYLCRKPLFTQALATLINVNVNMFIFIRSVWILSSNSHISAETILYPSAHPFCLSTAVMVLGFALIFSRLSRCLYAKHLWFRLAPRFPTSWVMRHCAVLSRCDAIFEVVVGGTQRVITSNAWQLRKHPLKQSAVYLVWFSFTVEKRRESERE